jgi:AraC family transcriptional regulator
VKADEVSWRRREEYVARINRVIDFIEGHIDEPLTLERLAAVACFSPFHFHRVFRALVGETLNRFTQRVRVEKAARQLTDHPRKSVTAIALDCAFSGSAAFARAFKEVFHVSASAWRAAGGSGRRMGGGSKSKIGEPVGKIGKDGRPAGGYSGFQDQPPNRRHAMQPGPNIAVEVKDMPELTLAYVRHIGAYQGNPALFGNLIARLMMWAGPRDLCRFPETKVIAVYHDDPKVTDEDKLRVSVGINVARGTAVEGEIGRMTLAGGAFAVARFEITTDQFERAWDSLYGGWLPASGYQPDDRPCYEVYHNDPGQHPEKKCVVDICVPVKPL